MDNTTNNDTVTLELPTPESLVQKTARILKTKTAKTILAVTGTAGALAATYVFGFRQGQDNVIEVLGDAADADETTYVGLEAVDVVEVVESVDSNQE